MFRLRWVRVLLCFNSPGHGLSEANAYILGPPSLPESRLRGKAE